MSGDNEWERRHEQEDERPSGRWRDEVEVMEGGRNDGGREESQREGCYINPLQGQLLLLLLLLSVCLLRLYLTSP